jgi:hypothetical protein
MRAAIADEMKACVRLPSRGASPFEWRGNCRFVAQSRLADPEHRTQWHALSDHKQEEEEEEGRVSGQSREQEERQRTNLSPRRVPACGAIKGTQRTDRSTQDKENLSITRRRRSNVVSVIIISWSWRILWSRFFLHRGRGGKEGRRGETE